MQTNVQAHYMALVTYLFVQLRVDSFSPCLLRPYGPGMSSSWGPCSEQG